MLSMLMKNQLTVKTAPCLSHTTTHASLGGSIDSRHR